MPSRLLPVALALLAGVMFPLHAGVVFFDDFEAGLSQWTSTGPWGQTAAHSVSGMRSATDSPGSYYADNVDWSLTMSSPVSLAGVPRPVLSFWGQLSLEDSYDFGRVEISTNGGSAWLAPLMTFTGDQPFWNQDQLDLAPYAGATQLSVRFRLLTDASVVKDGWYIDDVRIGSAPAAVTLNTPTSATPNSVTLTWSASTATNFLAYRVFRAQTSGANWHDARLVGTVTAQATLTFTDLTACPKTRYFYRVMVVNTDQLFALSNEVQATTPAGMDYPFVDNGEGGPGTWVADLPWTLSTNDFTSPTHSWFDSPGTNYAGGIANQSLTLSAPMSFLTAVAPVLSFRYHCYFAPSDLGAAEVSTNYGAGWTLLSALYGDSGEWRRGRLDLEAYAGAPAVLVRFRLTSNNTNSGDYWYLDDISVAESPSLVSTPTLDHITSHSIQVHWPVNLDVQFSCYAVFRDTAASVGINSVLVAAITNQATLSVTDSNLLPNTTYYYRVYAVNSWGTFSPNSPVPASATTANNPPPFSDDFEGPLYNWTLTGAWGKTTRQAHGGSYSLADSPAGDYGASADSQAYTTVDLSLVSWPVLRFWDRYAIDSNTRGLVVVNGQPVYEVTGTQGFWAQHAIDLSPWAGNANVQISFRLWNWSSGTADGWYIDDVSVSEQTPVALGYPFFDNFESGLGRWLPGNWVPSSAQPYSPTSAAHNKLADIWYGTTALGTPNMLLTMAGEIDLTNALNPQLVFWWRGQVSWSVPYYVQAYTAGQGWQTIFDSYSHGGFSGTYDWTRVQLSLTNYVTRKVRLRFYFAGNPDLYLDDVAVAEQPAAVALSAPVPHFKTVDLSWTRTASSNVFKRYELRRSSTPGVTATSLLVGTSSSVSQTNLTDSSGLATSTTYYYRVFVVDTNEVYAASNEASCTTVPLNYPLADNLNNLDQWIATGGWGLTTGSAHSGPSSLTDSPAGSYGPNSDSLAQTAVNLTGANWPVLRFWDRYTIDGNTRALVVVNGQPVYEATGTQADWTQHPIDLSPWAGNANVQISFRLWNQSSSTADGWYIDDVSVSEQTPVALGYPFFDNFESGLGRWLPGNWVSSSAQPYSPTSAAHNKLADIWYGTTALGTPNMLLTMGGEIDLTNALNPQLVFWWRGQVSWSVPYYVQAYTAGQGWQTIFDSHSHGGFSGSYDWTRVQLSLTNYVTRKIRLRFYFAGNPDLYWDDVAVAEQPAAVALGAPVPHFKTVDLSWTRTASSNVFKRYELRRSSTPGVTATSLLVGTSSSVSQTNLTDSSGLATSTTYYYRVFVVDTNEVYVASNEASCTTVPLNYPLADSLTNLDQWITTGDWGLTTGSARSGPSSLADSPAGSYGPKSDSLAQTAVNLSGASWPVLRFWDRYAIDGNTRALVVVNGQPVYEATGTQADWTQHAIDLSPWAGNANVQISFRLWNQGSSTADGWYIDDVSVSEQTPVALGFPFFDNFESGPGRWLPGNWVPSSAQPYSPTSAAHNRLADIWYGTTGLGTPNMLLTMGGEIDLTNALNPQLVFWWRGQVSWSVPYYVQAYTAGQGWQTIFDSYNHGGFSGIYDWTRVQLSLTNYVTRKIRLRFYFAGNPDLYLDDVAVAEQPAAVALSAPVPHFKTVDLSWTRTASSNVFKRYELRRSSTPGVTTTSPLVATITNPAQTNLTDSGALTTVSTYYYRVFVVDTNEAYVASNEGSCTLLPLGYPLADSMDNPGQWITTGAWGLTTSTAHSGPASLADSPAGSYGAGADSLAQTAVDLSHAGWPVLRFWDRYTIDGNTRGLVVVNGQPVYEVTGMQQDWMQHAIDLSPWAGNVNVQISFRLWNQGSASADGWYIDDLTIGEQAPVALGYPFFDDFETGLGRWLPGNWSITSTQPYDGANAVHNKLADIWYSMTGLGAPNILLTAAGEIDLTNALNPQLVFWWRGYVSWSQPYYVQAYAAGLGWQTIFDSHNNGGFSGTYDWTRVQVPLTNCVNKKIRLRLYSNGNQDLFVDHFGVGGVAPGAPSFNAPPQTGFVPVLRPTLVVNNAVQSENLPLTYQFEVYSDAGLSNLVAQVPALASGVSTTAWTVDVNLVNHAAYWWRCRASYLTNAGPWMPAATFHVDQGGTPPVPPVLASPVPGSVLPTPNSLLTWYPAMDPDPTDFVLAYHLQVDNLAAFTSPEIDAMIVMSDPLNQSPWVSVSVPLNSFGGATNLVPGSTYYWRVQSQDGHLNFSDWNSGLFSFAYIHLPPPTLTRMEWRSDSTVLLRWSGPTNNMYVEFTSSLEPPVNWRAVAGPFGGMSGVVPASSNAPIGFYRLRSE